MYIHINILIYCCWDWLGFCFPVKLVELRGFVGRLCLRDIAEVGHFPHRHLGMDHAATGRIARLARGCHWFSW